MIRNRIILTITILIEVIISVLAAWTLIFPPQWLSTDIVKIVAVSLLLLAFPFFLIVMVFYLPDSLEEKQVKEQEGKKCNNKTGNKPES